MKNVHLSLVLSLLAVVFSLTLPYSSCVNPGCNLVVYGFQSPLAYISVVMILLTTIASFVKRSVTISLLGLLFSLSNFFFLIFLIVVVSFFKQGMINYEMQLGSGIYVNLAAACFVLLVAVNDTYSSYKKKL